MVIINPLLSQALVPRSSNLLLVRRRSNSRWLLLLSIIGSALLAVTTLSAATTKTFLVNNTSSDRTVHGSLTWAVYQANYQGADLNKIEFKIPGAASGEVEIVLSETLYIARPMIIDATTMANYAGKPLIRINANKLDSAFCVVGNVAGVPPLSNGTPSSGSGSTIRGFRIMNYSSNGVTLMKGADSNTIADNYIGWAPLATPGTYFKSTINNPECRGIGIESNGNIIRGNTISGTHNAITIGFDIDAPSTPTCKNNVVEKNFIGTDPTGMTKIGNDSDGVFLGAGTQKTMIGPGNVLSGNASAGVELLHSTSTENRIFGNMIGLNATGTDVIGNGELGILIANGASENLVGGPQGGLYPGNVISGNELGAIAIGTAEWPGPNGSNNNRVENNLIGTNAAETAAIGKQRTGITIQHKSKGNIVRKNVIVGQLHHGVVFSDGATNNSLFGNWIGVTSRGQVFRNGSFGAYLFDASNNTVQPPTSSASSGAEQNIFGGATHGPVGVYGASASNVIEIPSRPLNISTRMRVETGDNALIAGFIVTGISPKTVIIRGLGPSLTVSGALPDPTLELNTSPAPIVNDDWRSTQQEAIIGSGVPPTSDLEPAIIATLDPGAYTVTMRGKGNSTGVGLVEVYELDSSASAVLANISTRGVVASGDNAMIAGFIIGGAQAAGRVVIRALGPSLSAAGVANPLNDPTLQLIDVHGTVVQSRDNWREDAAQAGQLTTLGLSPSNDLESAMIATLAPGAYTAVVSDKNGKSGIGLVEVYNLP
jgi:hypothetical protein